MENAGSVSFERAGSADAWLAGKYTNLLATVNSNIRRNGSNFMRLAAASNARKRAAGSYTVFGVTLIDSSIAKPTGILTPASSIAFTWLG